MICEITIINADFRIYENASHVVFKNTKTNKIKTKFIFWKSWKHFCRECYDPDMCQKQRKVLMFGEVGPSESYFCGLKIHGY